MTELDAGLPHPLRTSIRVFADVAEHRAIMRPDTGR